MALAMANQDWETPCPVRDDKIHCTCWYDGFVCCGCGNNGPQEDNHEDATPTRTRSSDFSDFHGP